MTPQRLQILRHLAKGKTLTPLEALAKFGTLRLSGRILELKAEGWPIKSRMVRVGSKYVAEYWYERPRAA
jgi:hypothetical protein